MTFEGLAFEEVVFEETISPPFPEIPEPIHSIIQVDTPTVGELGILLSRQLILQFTESIHGIPMEEIPADLVNDNLNELLNTLAGRILSGKLAENRLYSLGLPRSGTGSFPQISNPVRYLKFLVGENFLIIALPERFWTPDTWK